MSSQRARAVAYHIREGWGEIHLRGPITAEEAQLIIEAMAKSKMTMLIMTGNEIGDDGAVKLAEVVETMPELREVWLSHNKIGDVGARALCTALARCKMLHHVHLYGNKIGDASAEALAELMKNPSLRVLTLSMNPIGGDGLRRLASALPSSRLRRLELWRIEVGRGGMDELAEAVRRSGHLEEITVDYWRNLEPELAESKLRRAVLALVAATEPEPDPQGCLSFFLKKKKKRTTHAACAFVARDGDNAIMIRVLAWLIQSSPFHNASRS